RGRLPGTGRPRADRSDRARAAAPAAQLPPSGRGGDRRRRRLPGGQPSRRAARRALRRPRGEPAAAGGPDAAADPAGRAVMGQLFGTDGVRGIANVEPMTSEIALRLGRALAHVAKQSNRRHKILIGKDTRLSGYMLETAMASGICSMGVDVLLVGPLPTPGIAFLTRTLRADAGVVISASHNAFQDNGIKFFSPTGFKLADELEAEIERLVLSDSIDALRPIATELGKACRTGDADRVICVDERGEVVDGDEMMAMLAAELHAHGELRQGTVVATVMSNLGFHVAMRERGIRVVSTPVGDRSVVEEMVRGGYNLG